MPCADSSTICARRQLTAELVPRRMIRNRCRPSSSSVSRARPRSATRTAWRHRAVSWGAAPPPGTEVRWRGRMVRGGSGGQVGGSGGVGEVGPGFNRLSATTPVAQQHWPWPPLEPFAGARGRHGAVVGAIGSRP